MLLKYAQRDFGVISLDWKITLEITIHRFLIRIKCQLKCRYRINCRLKIFFYLCAFKICTMKFLCSSLLIGNHSRSDYTSPTRVKCQLKCRYRISRRLKLFLRLCALELCTRFWCSCQSGMSDHFGDNLPVKGNEHKNIIVHISRVHK